MITEQLMGEVFYQMKCSVTILCPAVIFFFPGLASPSSDSRQIKRVVVLYGLAMRNLGQEQVDEALQSIFNRDENVPILIEMLGKQTSRWNGLLIIFSAHLYND